LLRTSRGFDPVWGWGDNGYLLRASNCGFGKSQEVCIFTFLDSIAASIVVFYDDNGKSCCICGGDDEVDDDGYGVGLTCDCYCSI